MKLLIINGPNLNLLGLREPDIYGKQDYKTLCEMIKKACNGIDYEIFQSNHEGAIVDKIQSAYGKVDGIVINPAAYTHTSVAILDALKAVGIPTVEVHISDINTREEFRKHSFVSYYAEKQIAGHGLQGYIEAIDYLKEKLS
ncbi:MAG: type II 3-dehydroquinate dehydratase [Clostridia bacterium]|nr:type II 3-dehydroquinate dehydratase [Clostridia bacterium]